MELNFQWRWIKFGSLRKYMRIILSMFFYFDRSVQPLRINDDNEKEHSINLLLIEEDGKKHYCLLKN